MGQDTRATQNHLFELAHRAQEKASQARQRRIKRRTQMQAPALQDADANAATLRWLTEGSDTQRRGVRAEDRAAQHIQQQGLLVLARNIHCRIGEIDLVARDDHTLIFIEVRQRRSSAYGGAAASVDSAKQRRLVRTAQFFLPHFSGRYFNGLTPACRFDVITIDGSQLQWIQDAFDAAR